MVRHTLILAAIFACISLGGCTTPRPGSELLAEANSTPHTDADAIRQVSQTRTKAITFFDQESLQYGTGQVDPDVSRQFQMTPSGLRYRVLRHSDGRKPVRTDSVKVNYRGWLDTGREFDSSYDDKPISFPLSGVVAGWTEGMQLIGEGGMIELWVPPALGYGAQGRPGSVPPNATLHFVVELINVQ